jgi:hypothetical protein
MFDRIEEIFIFCIISTFIDALVSLSDEADIGQGKLIIHMLHLLFVELLLFFMFKLLFLQYDEYDDVCDQNNQQNAET